jgi:hypothetical protein
MQQGRVQLDADWNEQQQIYQHLRAIQTRAIIGTSGGPTQDAGFAVPVAADDKSLTIGSGRYYVDGMLCENDDEVAYDKQPYLPGASTPQSELTQTNTTVGLVYLDVWSRNITALDDPELREVALGGPDTTRRLKTVWQVKILPIAVKDPSQVVRGDASFPEWDRLVQPSSGALSARAQPAQNASDTCLLPPKAAISAWRTSSTASRSTAAAISARAQSRPSSGHARTAPSSPPRCCSATRTTTA